MGLAPVSDLLDHLLSTRPVVAADPLLGALPARCPPPVRRRTLTADVLADTITATLDNQLVAERAQLLGRRLRRSTGADPTVAFLANGSASDGSDRAQRVP